MENEILPGEIRERLRRAVERGTDHDLDAWAATGLQGLRLLLDHLTGALELEPRDVHARDEIDNLRAAVAAIAAAHPDDFLDVFGDPDLDGSGYVLAGLGSVDDPRATHRLSRAARAPDPSIRMDAAIGLGRRRSSSAVATLVELITDPDYLVRYHALEGLAAVGDGSALAALRDLAAPTPFERRLADEAIARILARTSSLDQSHPES